MDVRERLHEEWTQKYIDTPGWKHILKVEQRSGKTYCTHRILDRLGLYSDRILISYPDNKIGAEWIRMFEYYSIDYSNITLTNVSSLKKYTKEKYRVYIIDEINDMSEGELKSCAMVCKNSERVIGLSGTISHQTEMTLRDTLGMKVLISYSIEDAIRDGIISDYRVQIYTVPLDRSVQTLDKKGKLLTEKKRYDNYTYVIEQMKAKRQDFMFLALGRNRILQSSIAKRDRVIELLGELGDKRVIVFTGLTDAADSLGIPSFHSKTKDKTVFDRFKVGDIQQIAVANMGKSGATYSDLDYVIMTNLTYNQETTEQTLSRSLVLDYKDKTARIIIVTSDEPEELKKVRETLKGIDQTKIDWIKETKTSII